MDRSICSQAAAHVESLQAIAARLDAGDPPRRGEIDRALEDGAGCLIALRASLRRTGEAAGADERTLAELRSCSGRLAAALEEVRGRSAAGTPAGAAYGFVLPHRRPGRV